MTEDDAQGWLDAYGQAWNSYDPDAIRSLFSEHAEYRFHPWDGGKDVLVGREAIVRSWLDDRDKAGTYTGAWRPLIVRGERVVATGTSRYYTDSTRKELEREFYNLWILDFDDDGRCSSFTEWFMQSPLSG
jgi:hypothetical protein